MDLAARARVRRRFGTSAGTGDDLREVRQRPIGVSVTASSILGGFCGAVVGWVMSSPTLSQDVQTLLMFGILGILATIAADAAAAQASMSANDLARVRRRALLHVAVGIVGALIAFALVSWVMHFATT